ncbi:response regulator transcription factor [Nocardiopsis sp. RSe5-2]|uniref:Response regulator transcription factor n=1 Tax=Nocardiopsis endophytica TaxID=3018445 RepID=A0ABT4U9M0_9ACTN|nr:response regulator transcription factor [Nocardiopsis endophytica]MDA2813663.1 response regulator transcription factor [Nocardiopsis endophytica]
MIGVLLVDDQSLVRAGFAAILDAEEGITVLGEAEDGAEAVRAAERLRPDVVLMDIRMPRMDGLEASRRIAAAPGLEHTRIIVLTTYDEDEHLFAALRTGVSGFLTKDTETEDLVHAVRAAARGGALLSPGVTRRVLERFVPDPPPDGVGPAASLTGRQREVLRLVGRGLDNAGIAEALDISPATAKTHVNHVMTRMGARDRAQLVVAAYESGLVRPGDLPG